MRPKALIVDDERVMLDLLERIMDGNGYNVSKATNGDQAIEMMNNDIFDVIITDLQMGETNGVDVVRKAKEQDNNKIVIIITGSYEATYAIDAFRSGADDYVLKPFSMTDLLERLHVQEERQSLKYSH